MKSKLKNFNGILLFAVQPSLNSIFYFLLQVSLIANSTVFYELKHGGKHMSQVLMDYLKDEIAAKIAAAEDVVRSESEAKIKALEKEIAELKKKLAS